MIPLRDHNPSSTTPYVTWITMGLNIAVFSLMFVSGEARFEGYVDQYALKPGLVTQGQTLVTLFTSMYMHGSIGHIFGNMMFLRIFGDNLEDRLGHLGFLLFYLVCGLGATAFQIVTDPGSMIPNLGASGAIAGLMGGYLLLFPQARVDILIPFGGLMETATVPAKTMLLYWIGIQFLSGFGSLGSSGGGVAYWAHIGGFVAGLVLVKVFRAMNNTTNTYQSDQ